MRKFFKSSLVGLVLLIGATFAQAQCLLCGAVGFMLGSSSIAHASSQQDVPGGGGAVLYIAPRISERINDPLGVHIAATSVSGFSTKDSWRIPLNGATLQQIFDKTVADPNRYVVLEAMRVIEPGNISAAVFWFVYIEKEKMTPLDKLPVPMKK